MIFVLLERTNEFKHFLFHQITIFLFHYASKQYISQFTGRWNKTLIYSREVAVMEQARNYQGR